MQRDSTRSDAEIPKEEVLAYIRGVKKLMRNKTMEKDDSDTVFGFLDFMEKSH